MSDVRPLSAALETFLKVAHEEIGKGGGNGGTHGDPRYLLVVAVVECEVVFFEYKVEETGGYDIGKW